MAQKVKVWFDPEGDFLEVQFKDAPGFMRPTAHEAVMKRVDEQGRMLGFSVQDVSCFRKDQPLEAELIAGEYPPFSFNRFSLQPCLTHNLTYT
jgi:hypothetical protein